MRILQVITDTDRRGAQVFGVQLGQALEARGHTVTTVALTPGSNAARLPVPTLGGRARGLRTLRELRRLGGAHDVVVAHGSSTLSACAFSGRRFVYRQISDSRFWARGWARRLRVGVFLRRAQRVVALSERSREVLIEHVWAPADRITVVPNGVPAAGFAPAPPVERRQRRAALGLPVDDFLVLSLGALSSEKDVESAVRAVSGLTGVTLLVVGDGPEAVHLRAIAGVQVVFMATTDHPADFYCAADAMVLPSRSESMPATLVEAGLCALPCIASDVGSVSDVVLHEHTGLLVPAADVEAIRSAMARLRDEPEVAAGFGAAARQHCLEHFEMRVIAAQWEAVLQQTARAPRRSRR